MRKLLVSLLLLVAILGTCAAICNADRGGRKGIGGHKGGRRGRGGDHGGRGGDLPVFRLNYYLGTTCPSVEAIVRDIVWRNVSHDPSLPAKLLRLHYHDCFVRVRRVAMDQFFWIQPQQIHEAGPNRSLSGYEIIDLIKQTLEKLCPGVVSCADILALAAQDAVSFQFQRPMWPVFTGRKDGRISRSSEASAGLPSAFANFSTLLANFQSNNLDIVDLGTLSGAHTVGKTHCSLVSRRLYNFTGKGDTDPSLNPVYVQTLKKICPQPVVPSTLVDMDPEGSATNFDSHYYVALKQNMGIFRSDAALLTDPRSAALVDQLQNPNIFFLRFAQSMIKMGAIGVLTNDQGEVRNNCRVVNPLN